MVQHLHRLRYASLHFGHVEKTRVAGGNKTSIDQQFWGTRMYQEFDPPIFMDIDGVVFQTWQEYAGMHIPDINTMLKTIRISTVQKSLEEGAHPELLRPRKAWLEKQITPEIK